MSTKPKLPTIDDQRKFWNWHWEHWEDRKVLNDWTERRAREILGLIRNLDLPKPKILDFGCGKGWFTERLADLGEAHGIDLSPEAIAWAQERRPDIHYLAGSVYDAPLPAGFFDILVSQEVIAHVDNQMRYLDRATDVLKTGGYLIITTGNKYVMDRLGDVGWNIQPKDHIATQLSVGQMKKMLAPRYKILKASTIIPHGTKGILRFVNSFKVNSILRSFISQEKLDALKERAGLGWQMIILAQKTR